MTTGPKARLTTRGALTQPAVMKLPTPITFTTHNLIGVRKRFVDSSAERPLKRSPRREAKSACESIREAFVKATIEADSRGLKRLPWDRQCVVLKRAYRFVAAWRDDEIIEPVIEYLQETARASISPDSGPYLTLLRAALPRLDPKQASKWAAALEYVNHRRLSVESLKWLLERNGGIEGAAKKWTKIRSRRRR
jgi:hypothetical protein